MFKKILILTVALTLMLCLAACGGDNSTQSSDNSTPNSDTAPGLKNFEGLSFSDKTVTYNGQEHAVEITGAMPKGASVSYSDNKGVNAGVYNAEATVSCDGYNTLTLKATLTVNKADITGITFTGNTLDYDTLSHSIEIEGQLPQGVSVSYSGGEDGENSAVNSGEYKIIATVSGDNYNTLTLNAALTVNKLSLEENGIAFDDGSFEYDANQHSITVTGNIPMGVSVSYSGGENGENGATNVGEYEITATVSGKNYEALTLTATLKISTTEELLHVFFHNGLIYFQNALDKNSLYVYDGTVLEKVSRDVPTNMISVGDDMFYVNTNLLSNTITMISSDGTITDLFDTSAEMLITDGDYLYYNVNSLLNSEKTGIFKIKISDLKNKDAEAVPVKLTSAKSDYLTYANGYIYFSNKSEGSKLYAISTSSSNAEPKLIYNYKVTDIISDGNTLYFTREITLSNLSAGSAIYSIDVSDGLYAEVNDQSQRVVKITMSRGKYLAKIDDYIYFVNTDMATSRLYGDGIYMANANGSGWIEDSYTLLIGSTQVINGENDNIYSLTTDGEYLYYYRANTKHLYQYDISTGMEYDLMYDFLPPVENTVITTYDEEAVMYKGEIYFINMLDGGKLYKYNPQTDSEYRLTGTQVADFAIYKDYIYYTTVKLLVNYDLYRMSLINGEPELISEEKCMNLSFCEDIIYYTNYSSNNTLNSMNLDGSDNKILYGDKDKDEESVSAGDTVIYDGFVYFVANDQLYRYDIAKSEASLVNKNLKPLEYLIYDGKILMMNCDGLQNHIDIYDIETGKATNLSNLGLSGISDDVRGMFIYEGEFYFYRNVAAGSKNKGLYKVENNEVVLIDTLDGYYICNSMVDGDKLYFINVWQIKDSLPTLSSDGYIYALDLETLEITEMNKN